MANLSQINAGQVYPRRGMYLDYVAGAEKLGAFYKYYPANKEALLGRVEELGVEPKARVELGQALIEYNRQIGAGSAALENAKLLGEGRALAVVTGQQAGFVGGPLYNVYKAVSAIRLAKYLRAATGRAVAPVFWIATEDSNMGPITGSTWVDRQGQLRQIRADLPDTGQQICDLIVEKEALAAFEELAELMPESEFRSEWQELYQPKAGELWGQWFGRIYAKLFGREGLVLLEPRVVYRAAGPMLGQIVEGLDELQQVFEQSSAELGKQGYEPQIDGGGRGMIYLIDEGQRRGIVAKDDKLVVGETEDYTVGELSELAEAHPERFSCSAALRPVVQDTLLATVAYVAGPGEVSYYGQLGGLYERLGVGMPVIWPRASMTLIEPKIARLMAKSGVSEQALLGESDPRAAVAAPNLQTPAAKVLRELAGKSQENIVQLAQKITEHDESAEKFANKISKRVERDIERLLRRGLELMDEREQISQRQYERIRVSLRPGGRPQERSFSLFGYLVYYGRAVVEEISQGVDVFDFEHCVVYLDFGTDEK